MATIIKHPEGNTLRMRIPLTERFTSLEGGQESTSYRDFIPNANYPVKVLFLKGSTKYELTASVTGNVVEVIDYGTIAKGVYAIEVLCRDENGDKRRYKQRAVLEVVDLTADAGIDAGVEFDVTDHYLDAAVFVTSGSQGGTVDQVQADWEQEDETAVDFIKNKPTIPTIPTNVSAFTNDAGYLTQHQDISGKVDKVPGKGLSTNDYTTAEKDKLAGLSNDYNDLSNKPTIPDVSGLATKTEVNTGLAGKVDKETGKSLMSDAEHTKLQNLPTAAELEQALANAGADVSVTTNQDGTFTIHVGDDDYTVNLNHTHENMAKLVVCKESDLPSTLAKDTIYAQVDDADTPTEIQSLWIAGLEFVGGSSSDEQELPDGYVECEYVQSSDPPVIVTNISPVGTKWMLDLEASAIGSNQVFICSKGDGGLFASVNADGNFALGASNVLSSATTRSKVSVEFITDGTIMTIGSNSTQRLSANNTHHGNNVNILGINNLYRYVGKIYRIECTYGGAFIGIPAFHVSTGVYGIYEKSSQTFITGNFVGVTKQ